MVVEDEQQLADLLGTYLEHDGFEVSVVHDGLRAVTTAREVDPDVVVLDLGLPGLDGVEVCRQLRTFSDAYVVMLTARTDEVVAEVLLGDAQTFEDACRAARKAQPEWAAVPAPIRGRVIAQVGRLVEANKEALSRLVTQEVGKPYAESLGEVQEIIDTCDFFLGEGRRLYGQTVPSEMPDKQLFTHRVPVGAVAVITCGGVMFGWLRTRTGSLWPVAIAHAMVNVCIVESPYLTSGDLDIAAYFTGEAGIFTFVATAIVAIVLARRANWTPRHTA